jgi:streptomycin 6-kinase
MLWTMPTTGAFSPDVAAFRHLGATEDGRSWLRTLPALVEDLEVRWNVRTGSPFRDGTASWAAPAQMGDGRPAVLKVSFPHREARNESVGLRLWCGHGAPVLYRAEPDVYALLMEHCIPGEPLAGASIRPEAGLDAAAAVLRELWIEPPADHGLERLRDVCLGWAEGVRERYRALAPSFDPGLVALGVELLESLPGSASAEVVVHGDANPTNFLSAGRRPWLAIDAKPMVGDAAYDLAPLVLQLGNPLQEREPATVLRHRFAMLADALGQSYDRLVGWSLARGVEAALWYVSRGDVAAGSEEMKTNAMLAGLLSA